MSCWLESFPVGQENVERHLSGTLRTRIAKLRLAMGVGAELSVVTGARTKCEELTHLCLMVAVSDVQHLVLDSLR